MAEDYSLATFIDNNGIRVQNTSTVNDTTSDGYPAYDPTYPVPYARQRVELAVIVVANALTLMIIIGRTWFRCKKLKSLRADDKWMLSAGALLVLIYWPSQILNNYWGSGLYFKNIPNNLRTPLWIASWGFFGYFMISSIIKVSICYCYLLIIPFHHKTFRRLVYGLCAFVMVLGIVESCLWLFDCVPFASNFDPNVLDNYCLDLDIPRYIWLGLSVIIDFIILAIPFKVLKVAQLRPHEKRILMMVFSANLFGTATCIIGFYGIWSDRFDSTIDLTYSEAPFIITNDLEILFYTLGASFPVLSPYLISWGGAVSRKGTMFSSRVRGKMNNTASSGTGTGGTTDMKNNTTGTSNNATNKEMTGTQKSTSSFNKKVMRPISARVQGWSVMSSATGRRGTRDQEDDDTIEMMNAESKQFQNRNLNDAIVVSTRIRVDEESTIGQAISEADSEEKNGVSPPRQEAIRNGWD